MRQSGFRFLTDKAQPQAKPDRPGRWPASALTQNYELTRIRGVFRSGRPSLHPSGRMSRREQFSYAVGSEELTVTKERFAWEIGAKWDVVHKKQAKIVGLVNELRTVFDILTGD
jgi:hypothetical protein